MLELIFAGMIGLSNHSSYITWQTPYNVGYYTNATMGVRYNNFEITGNSELWSIVDYNKDSKCIPMYANYYISGEYSFNVFKIKLQHNCVHNVVTQRYEDIFPEHKEFQWGEAETRITLQANIKHKIF